MSPSVVDKLSIVTLMGLPGSGKSTLAEAMEGSFADDKDVLCITVRYDDLVPLDVQKEFMSNSQAAKTMRKNFVQCVQWLACWLLKGEELAGDLSLSTEVNNLHPVEFLKRKCQEILGNIEDGEKYEKGFLIVDDNNYYSSMRNELYQIAKKFQCSFCVLYLKCGLEEAVKRNQGRSSEFHIAREVIEEMSKKLEEPNPMENPCDLFCVQIAQSEAGVMDESVRILLEHSLENPVVYIPPPDRLEDRRICSESELHQADLVLRKWINSQMTICSFTKPPAARKQYSTELNARKSQVLQKLRTGELKLSAQLNQDIEFYHEVVGYAKAVAILASQSDI